MTYSGEFPNSQRMISIKNFFGSAKVGEMIGIKKKKDSEQADAFYIAS